MSKALHTPTHMSPAQVAQATGVSRWTVMRAIKSHDLPAMRDNKNQWKVEAKDVEAWRPHTEKKQTEAQPSHTSEEVELAAARVEILYLKESLAASQVETERWRTMAEKMAERYKPRWFWKRS